jgi:ribosomal protein S18 acetylase RimI-like enzyme
MRWVRRLGFSGMSSRSAVGIRRVRPEEWEQLRRIRIRALEESPESFGSTAREARQQDDADWRTWAEIGGCSPTTAVFVAVERGVLVGLCGVFLLEHDCTIARIVAMWVDPDFRGRRLAEQLLDAASAWSTGSGARDLVLDVTESNESARRLYARAGFHETGTTTRLRSNASLLTLEMHKPLRDRADHRTRAFSSAVRTRLPL